MYKHDYDNFHSYALGMWFACMHGLNAGRHLHCAAVRRWVCFIDVKSVDPKNKKTLKRTFNEKIIKTVKTLKKALLTNKQNYSNQMKRFSTKIIVFVSYSMRDNVGERSLRKRISLAAMLNSSLKSRFM